MTNECSITSDMWSSKPFRSFVLFLLLSHPHVGFQLDVLDKQDSQKNSPHILWLQSGCSEVGRHCVELILVSLHQLVGPLTTVSTGLIFSIIQSPAALSSSLCWGTKILIIFLHCCNNISHLILHTFSSEDNVKTFVWCSYFSTPNSSVYFYFDTFNPAKTCKHLLSFIKLSQTKILSCKSSLA